MSKKTKTVDVSLEISVEVEVPLDADYNYFEDLKYEIKSANKNISINSYILSDGFISCDFDVLLEEVKKDPDLQHLTTEEQIEHAMEDLKRI
jgi:hypothetical protein